MDPKTRCLLRVDIDNYLEADRIFGLLMGSQVDPRRRFIIDRALKVRNLDV
jgi:DNA gyrase subunit B